MIYLFLLSSQLLPLTTSFLHQLNTTHPTIAISCPDLLRKQHVAITWVPLLTHLWWTLYKLQPRYKTSLPLFLGHILTLFIPLSLKRECFLRKPYFVSLIPFFVRPFSIFWHGCPIGTNLFHDVDECQLWLLSHHLWTDFFHVEHIWCEDALWGESWAFPTGFWSRGDASWSVLELMDVPLAVFSLRVDPLFFVPLRE